MSNRHQPRSPPCAQGNRGWEKRVPLTYAERYQHLSWMPEYEEYCRIVEKSRRDAADRKYETLVQRSAKSVARNLCRISPEAVASLPDHVLGLVIDEVMANPKILMTLKHDIWDAFPLLVLQEIWDRLYQSQQLNLHLWKALSSRLRAAKSEHGKDLRLYRFDRVITPSEDKENWDFTIYTRPLISPTFDFIASLSLGTALPMIDYIRLSSIVNLGTLEISDRLGYLPKAEKEPPPIDLDRLFRAWASRAEGGTAFQVLRSLRVDFKEMSLTTNILPHLNKFPALGIVYPGTTKWSYEKGKMANRGKYVSDYDFRSIRPLLPQGWKGVTIRGPTNGTMRDVHNSMKYSAAVEKWKGLLKDDYQAIMGKERVRRERIGHEITTTPFNQRLKDRHCLHEMLDFSMMHRLPFSLRSVFMGPCTRRCAASDSPVLWHGHCLVDLPADAIHEDPDKVSDDACNGRYVALSHSTQCGLRDLVDCVKHAEQPSSRLLPSQQSRMRLNQKRTYDPAKSEYKGSIGTYDSKTHPRPTPRDEWERHSYENVSATQEEETWDFIKSTTSNSSCESETYHHSTCPLYSTGAYHTSPPNLHIQCYNCTRNHYASAGTRASCNSALDDHETLGTFDDDTVITIGEATSTQRLWNHEKERPSLKPTFWNEKQFSLHPSYAKQTAARGLQDLEWRLHAQDVLEGKPTGVKMDNNLAKRESVGDVYERHYGWPMPKPLKNVSETHGDQIRKRIALHGGRKDYHMSTARVRGMEFGILGGITSDKDLEAVGMDAGTAMPSVAGDGEWMLKVKSKVPIVTLRIGESVKARVEGEMVLLREDWPSEEEKGRAKKSGKEHKEDLGDWFRPPRREKTENKEKVGEKLMDGREEISLRKVKKAKEKAEKEAKGFDKSFWEMVGLPPPQAGQGS